MKRNERHVGLYEKYSISPKNEAINNFEREHIDFSVILDERNIQK